MFKKKNKIVPLTKVADKYKFKGLKRVDECDKLHNFFKTKVRIEMGDRNYITTFYVVPRETKSCNIL